MTQQSVVICVNSGVKHWEKKMKGIQSETDPIGCSKCFSNK